MAATLAEQSGALVRRARAGDQNAMALIKGVGEVARKGANTKAKQAYALIKRYIAENPPPKETATTVSGGQVGGGLFGFGGEVPGLPSAPEALVHSAPTEVKTKAPLPKGALDNIFDPDAFVLVVVRACKYHCGLPAAAVVLASGPSLESSGVEELGLSLFGTEQASAAFFQGVRHCTDADIKKFGVKFDEYLRKPFIVGQCVGRAWRIQAVRRPGSRISVYAPVAGWEMGE